MSGRRDASRLTRVFGGGENPVSWSLPVAALPGLTVRLHLVFLVFISVRLAQSIQTDHAGLVFQLAGMAGLLLLVGAHELGHVLAARRAGLSHDRLVLWPLGGLDHGEHPGGPSRLARIAASGPAVNLALLLPLAALTRWTAGSWEAVFFDPFAFRESAVAASAEGLAAWLVWTLHAYNVMLLAFNLLVPMHPFDAGRLVQALAWRGRGELPAARISGTTGVVTAAVLAAVGLIANETALLGIAVIGAFVSWQELDRARFLAAEPEAEDAGEDWTIPPESAEDSDSGGLPDGQEVDRILAKISEHGIRSLSEEERRTLDRASAAGTDH